MTRLTEKNVYLPYRSTDEIVREALENHEKTGKEYGWKFFFGFLAIIILNDTAIYFLLR